MFLSMATVSLPAPANTTNLEVGLKRPRYCVPMKASMLAVLLYTSESNVVVARGSADHQHALARIGWIGDQPHGRHEHGTRDRVVAGIVVANRHGDDVVAVGGVDVSGRERPGSVVGWNAIVVPSPKSHMTS